MANRVRIKWNRGGLYKLRSEPGVKAREEQLARGIAQEANSRSGTGGYKVSSRQGAKRPQGRWRTTVITANFDAIRDNARHNTLVKILAGGGVSGTGARSSRGRSRSASRSRGRRR